MCLGVYKIIFLFLPVHFSKSTIDINLAEYQYIADHLSTKECHQLVAALHFHVFELSKDLNSAERRIPDDVPCIDLLLYWNSAPKEGRGRTHVEVCHRLNQIGREDLARWLSKTVFYQISKDLKLSLTTSDSGDTTRDQCHFTELYSREEIVDEAPWWKLDSVLEIFIVTELIVLTIGCLFLCCLCCTENNTKCQKPYEKLPLVEN